MSALMDRATEYQRALKERAAGLTKSGDDPDHALMMESLALIIDMLAEQESRSEAIRGDLTEGEAVAR